MKKIDELFVEQEKVPRKIIIASTILWIGMFLFYRLSESDFNLKATIDSGISDVKFLSQTIFVIMTNILAAMIFTHFYRAKESKRINVLSAISQQEFMKTVLKDMAHYKGIYCESHDVYVKLRKHPTRNDILICDLTYKYKKSDIEKDTKFTIYRISNDTDRENLPLISDECLKNEFVWYNDETDFDDTLDISDYSISNLMIGKTPYELKRVESNSGLVITYSCVLDAPPSAMSFVTYKVSIPVELESMITITAEFPSNGGGVTFDYSDLSDDLDVSAFPRTGLKSNPVDLSSENGIKQFQHADWLLPKDGYVFSWWKKR